jgi:hypothetical protein
VLPEPATSPGVCELKTNDAVGDLSCASSRRIAWQKLAESCRHKLELPKAPVRPRAAFLFFSADIIDSVRVELQGVPSIEVFIEAPTILTRYKFSLMIISFA